MKKRICIIAAALVIVLTACAETKSDTGKGSVRSVKDCYYQMTGKAKRT